jgi:hypothetical protein
MSSSSADRRELAKKYTVILRSADANFAESDGRASHIIEFALGILTTAGFAYVDYIELGTQSACIDVVQPKGRSDEVPVFATGVSGITAVHGSISSSEQSEYSRQNAR